MKALRSFLFSTAFFLFLSALFYLPSSYAVTVSFEQKITRNGQPLDEFKVQLKEKKFRVESPVRGVLISSEKGTFNYYPEQKRAIRLQIPAGMPSPADDLSDFPAFLKRNNAKNVGSEKIGAYDCDVYEFDDPTTRMKSKAWVWKDKNFPVQIEGQMPGGVLLIGFQNLVIDADIPDSQFELPADTQIQEMPAMPVPPQSATPQTPSAGEKQP